MKLSESILCGALAVASIPAIAASIPDGMKASTACQACHGGDGISVLNNAPNLAGQKTAYLAQQLHSFKSGDRKHDMMNPIAKLLSDSDIENLAAFWNSLPAAGDKRETVAAAAQARKSRMMFPVEFPKGFRVYRTDESAEGNSIGSFYANSAAWQAAQTGKPLPEGSTIVVVNSRAKLDANKKPVVDSSGHWIADGAPTSYSAMESSAGWGKDLPDLIRNGDWNYALFDAQHTTRREMNYAICLGCHKGVADDSYVFTLKELAKKSKER